LKHAVELLPSKQFPSTKSIASHPMLILPPYIYIVCMTSVWTSYSEFRYIFLDKEAVVFLLLPLVGFDSVVWIFFAILGTCTSVQLNQKIVRCIRHDYGKLCRAIPAE
jgi:hypothetical protein